MERSVSVEDFLSGLLRMQTSSKTGMGNRTDSEAAFQEFLKRIPSAQNLAGQQSDEKSSWLGTSPSSASLSFLANGSVSNLHAHGGGSDITAANMPRIPSLDMLRFVSRQQPMESSPIHAVHNSQQQQLNGTTGALSMPEQQHVLQTNQHGALGSLGMNIGQAIQLQGMQMPAGANLLQALPAYQQMQMQNPLQMSTLSAANLQLNELNNKAPLAPQHPPSTSSGGGGDQKNEQRRSRRMLSNRESARRSRKRKQEQLNELESQIGDLEERNERLESQCQQAALHVQGLMNDKTKLENENKHLLGILSHLRESLGHERIRLHIPSTLAASLDAPSSATAPVIDSVTQAVPEEGVKPEKQTQDGSQEHEHVSGTRYNDLDQQARQLTSRGPPTKRGKHERHTVTTPLHNDGSTGA